MLSSYLAAKRSVRYVNYKSNGIIYGLWQTYTIDNVYGGRNIMESGNEKKTRKRGRSREKDDN